MVGWLIVNSFIDTKKFNEIYSMLSLAAIKKDINIELVKSDKIINKIGKGFIQCKKPDFAIFWDKDIYLAQMLEQHGIRLFNSSKAIEYCDNKSLTAIKLSQYNIPMPDTIIAPKTFEGIGYNSLNFVQSAISILGLPMIIKESYGSFGKQVYLAHTLLEANTIIEKLGYKDFIMQKYIGYKKGCDIRINVVGERVVSSVLRYNNNDFRSNVSNGGKMKTYNANKPQKDLAINVCKVLGLDFAGVDVLIDENENPIICEVNSNPHFKSTLDCTGINMADYIMEYIGKVL